MNNTNFKGIIFAFLSLVFGIATFLPYITITTDLGNGPITESSSLMPGAYGFIAILIACFSIFTVFGGMKNKSALGGAAASIFMLIKFFTDDAAASKMEQSLKVVNELATSLFGSGDATTTFSWGHSIGFYIMVAAAVLMLIFGMLYTLSED